jgi:hypothetical protein
MNRSEVIHLEERLRKFAICFEIKLNAHPMDDSDHMN